MEDKEAERGRFGRFLVGSVDAFCYGIEIARGMIIDPSRVFVRECRKFLRSSLVSRPTRGVEDVRRSAEFNYSYRLNRSPLSFFDMFLCSDGVPTYPLGELVPSDNSKDAASPSDEGPSEDETKAKKEPKLKSKKESVFEAKGTEAISVSSFSSDGSKFAICYVSGKVIVYDTDHGIQHAVTFMKDETVSNVSFLNEESSVLLMCTKDYTCWKWDVDKEGSQPFRICNRRVLSYIEDEITSQRSDFCENGTKLVFSSIIVCEEEPMLDVVLVDTTLDYQQHSAHRYRRALLERNLVISHVLLSPDEKGVLVGLMDRGWEDSHCLLWPDYNEDSARYKKLVEATTGSWSNESTHVVTWVMTNCTNSHVADETSAFIWNIEDVRKNLTDSQHSWKAQKITNPFGDKVFWCQLTKDMDGKDRLIMGISGEVARFLFWEVSTKTHTHTIATGVQSHNMMLSIKEKWIKCFVNEEGSIHGLYPTGMMKDGSMFGAILGMQGQAMIWDAKLGVEVLKVTLRDLQANQLKDGTNLVMNHSTKKFAIVGKNGAMVFCPALATAFNSQKESPLGAQMVQLEIPRSSQSNETSYKIIFSGDGDSLGVLCTGSSKMQVWNLHQGTSCSIGSNVQNAEGARIQDFCLSNNGKYLAICTGKCIYIMDCEDKDVAQTVGEINLDSEVIIDLEIVHMGIKDDASKLVFCMKDGSILWYELSYENAPSTSNIHGFGFRKRTTMETLTSWLTRPRVDVNEPLIQNNGGHQLNVGYTSIPIRSNTRWLTYKGHVLAKELDEASFQVSPNFKDVIRFSESQKVEAWDLETKTKLKDGASDISFIKKSSHSYSHNSSISEQVHHELTSETSELLIGTSIDLSRRTTLVQSSRENIIVGGNCSSRSFSRLRDQASLDAEQERDEHEDPHSVYVINLKGGEYRRRLSGKNLEPGKGLAISHDGRHIACLADEDGQKVIVWNAYASERLLPDYNFLSLTLEHGMYRKDGIARDIQPLINEFGINFFNFRHPSGMSMMQEAIFHNNINLLRGILEYVSKKKIKVSFLDAENQPPPVGSSSSHGNAIRACISRRAPKTLAIVLKYLLRRVTHEVELAAILTDSLIPILASYPSLFCVTIRHCKVLGPECRIEVTERSLEEHNFIPVTIDYLNASVKQTERVLRSELDKDKGDEVVPSIASTARVFPYKHACSIGVPGLLRDLLVNEAHHFVFSSFVVRAIVEYKWRNYAEKLFIHELIHHCMVAVSFSVYFFVLCTDGTYKMGYFNGGSEEESRLTKITLYVCVILAIPCLFRELRQCVMYSTDHKLRGFVFWLKSGWNWIEVVSYLNLVIVVPLGQSRFLKEGQDATILSAVVAVESLLLWSRMLFYARPFCSTGPLVATMTSIVRELYSFLFLALSVMFGFALAFRVLYRHVEFTEEDEEENTFHYMESNGADTERLESVHKAFGTFRRSFFTVFGYTFGDFDLQNQYNAPEPVTALILFVLYVVILAIILLNMLIALMSDKFARIHKNRKTRLIEARARAIDDIDSMLSHRQRNELEKKIEKYLLVVIPTHHHASLTKGYALRKTPSKANADMVKVVKTQIRMSLDQSQNTRDVAVRPLHSRHITTQDTLAGRGRGRAMYAIQESGDSATAPTQDEGPSGGVTETEMHHDDSESTDSFICYEHSDSDSD